MIEISDDDNCNYYIGVEDGDAGDAMEKIEMIIKRKTHKSYA